MGMHPHLFLLAQLVLPCATATTPCERWVGDGTPARSKVYASYPLDAPNPNIIVPECGHNDRCIFTTDVVFPMIFPPQG